MKQYVIKTICLDDYYATWSFQTFTSDQDPEVIVQLAKDRIEPLNNVYNAALFQRNAIWEEYPEAIYDTDFPEGTFDECDILDREYNKLSWVACNNNTGFYIHAETNSDRIEVITVEEYLKTITSSPPEL